MDESRRPEAFLPDALGEFMTKLRRWIVRLLIGLMVAIPLTAVCLYWVNPFGARSYDR